MQDPVVAADGHTYERTAIERWFQNESTSPFRESLPNKNLLPNITLRKLIDSAGLLKAKKRRIVILMDVSGSMDQNTKVNGVCVKFRFIDIAKNLCSVLYRMLCKDFDVIVMTYSNDVNTLTRGSHTVEELENILEHVNARGCTNTQAALESAMKYHCPIFFFTDGQESGYNPTPYNLTTNSIVTRINFENHKVYPVAIGDEANFVELARIAQKSKTFFSFMIDPSKVKDVGMCMVANALFPVAKTFTENFLAAKHIVVETVETILDDAFEKFLSGTKLDSAWRQKMQKKVHNVMLVLQNQNSLIQCLAADMKEIILGLDASNWDRWGHPFLIQYMHNIALLQRFNNAQIQLPIHQVALQNIQAREYKPPEQKVEDYRRYCESRNQTWSDMSTQETYDAGCFSDGTVKTKGGEKLVSQLKAGDEVLMMTSDFQQKYGKVTHVLRSKGRQHLVGLDGLYVSAYHPIYDGKVKYPADDYDSTEFTLQVYNIVVKQASFIKVNNTFFAVPGHGVTTGKMAHPYLSKKILEDLKEPGVYDVVWKRKELISGIKMTKTVS